MSSFMISIPKDEPELRDEIEEQLAAYARVSGAARGFGPDEIKMIIDIIQGASGIAVNVTAITTFLLMLKDRYKNSQKPSGIRIAVPGKGDVPLDELDAAILKRMLGLEKQ